MTQPTHASRGHVELSPSSASRWMNCPGSISLSRGVPDRSSWFADEGTAAHELCEKTLRSGGTTVAFIGQKFGAFEVTPDMAANANVYVDHVLALRAAAGVGGLLEHRFSLKKFNPPAPMSGTADFVLHDKRTRTLHVVDLKYGAGVPVDVNDNPQLKYYALGAMVSLDLTKEVDAVHMTIVQPRLEHPDGYVRTQILLPETLLDFAMELLVGAEAALVPGAALKTGSHCRFCKAHPVCPQVREEAAMTLGEEFELVTVDENPAPFVPPDPRLMTLEQVAALLPKLDAVEGWIKSLRGHAHSEAEAGNHVPGYKIVAKRATRKYAVSEEDVLKLAKKYKLGKKDIYESSILSPAQLEKLFGKSNPIPSNFFKKESSGTTLVEDTDPRPAVNLIAAGDEFASHAEDDLL